MRVGMPLARASEVQSEWKPVQLPVFEVRQYSVLPTGEAFLFFGSFTQSRCSRASNRRA